MDFSLTPLLVVTGISVALALVIVIVEKLIIKAGPVTLKLNDAEPKEIEGGGSLLGALKDEGVLVPSACGGRGSCGMCKVKVFEGGGKILATEAPHLTEEERGENVRLSCQIKVRENLVVEVPTELLDIEEYEVLVTGAEPLNHDTMRVTLTFGEGVEFSFRAGQYVQLETPIYDGLPAPTQRAYSIASPPQEKSSIDLIIRRVKRGVATTFVHDLIEVDDELTLSGPYGDFYLRDTPAEAIFIAGGSGLAPFEAILADMAAHKNEKNVTLIFGAVNGDDLYDLDKMRGYEETIPNFRFVPALSSPREEERWEGEVGLVTDVAGRLFESMEGMEGYLCGGPGMIDACIEAMTERGIREEEIFYDKFS
ncbi:MAG: oxidoreductase [Deltaproteobacteria bacterium]|nr:MAG: oxidoreductase [Deltaproteobacteria bacterium]